MKVIFLDFDGVINNFNEWEVENGGVNLHPRGNMSKSNVEPLKYLLAECLNYNIKIVISSAWNIWGVERCLESLSNIIDRELLNDIIIGCTRYLDNDECKIVEKRLHVPKSEIDGHEYYPNRGIEILDYMSISNIQSYAMIDDIDNFLHIQKDRWIKTDDHVGLTFELVDECINLLVDKIS